MNATAPIHILVIDDEPEKRSILRRGFEAEGYEASEVAGRSGLLRCVEQLPVSLITLDLDLTGENWLELAREVRAKRNVPIVLIRGKGRTNRSHCWAGGGSGRLHN
jgi:two-component system, OmpR family, response regulator